MSAASLLQCKHQPAQSRSALWDRLEISSYTTTSIESGALSFHIKLNGTETDFTIADNGTRNTHHVKLDLSENVYPSLLGMSLSETQFPGSFFYLKKLLTVASVNNGCEGSSYMMLHRWRPEPFIIVMKVIMGPCKDCLIISVLFFCIPHNGCSLHYMSVLILLILNASSAVELLQYVFFLIHQ